MLRQQTVLLADISGLSTVFVFALPFGCIFAGFVVFDSGDSVIAVEPFAEVYKFAPVAAERIILFIAAVLSGRLIDNFLTYRTLAFHIAHKSNIHTTFYKGFLYQLALDIYAISDSMLFQRSLWANKRSQ